MHGKNIVLLLDEIQLRVRSSTSIFGEKLFHTLPGLEGEFYMEL